MRKLIAVSMMLFALCFCASSHVDRERERRLQELVEVLVSDQIPTVGQFLDLLGPNDESELELQLASKYPDVDWRITPLESVPGALEFSRRLHEDEGVPSFFLQCLRGQLGVERTAPRLIQRPPAPEGNFIRYKVVFSKVVLVVSFIATESIVDSVRIEGKGDVVPICVEQIRSNRAEPANRSR